MRTHLGKLESPLDGTISECGLVDGDTTFYILNIWQQSDPKKAQCIALTAPEVFWLNRSDLDVWYSKMWETSIAAQVDDMVKAAAR